jgi:Carboxypeptidase regulatory-like domain/TonB-dependent Receptor Plug Domain/Gram-negative bacterial TonB protein C-terminal
MPARSTRSSTCFSLSILGATLVVARVATAQSLAISGRVTAESGFALRGADVTLDGTSLHATTGEDGAYRLNGVPAGSFTVRARRLGFKPGEVRITVPSSAAENLSIQLSTVASDLRPVVVTARTVKYSGRLAGYYERLERRTSGVFITRQDIEDGRPRTLSQLLQRTPGITISRQRDGSTGLRMRDRSCAPLIWIDGSAMPTGQIDLDTFEPSSLEGIELYLGSTNAPARYSWSRDLSNCGTILLWTRGSESEYPHVTVKSPTEIESLVASLAVFTPDGVDKVAVLDSASARAIPYPPSLFAAHTTGTVIAEFIVDAEGHMEPDSFGIVASTHPLFSEAVRRALSSAIFTPAQKAGNAVRQLVQQSFEFTAIK